MMNDDLKKRLEHVKKRIKEAADACKRPVASIRLVAVSKTMPAEVVAEAIDAGVTHLGENYIQEAKEKMTALATYPATWHFIGICSPIKPNTPSGCLTSFIR